MHRLASEQGKKILKELVGERIIAARRQLFKDDLDLRDCEQNADGPLEIELEGGRFITFTAVTEALGINIIKGRMPAYGPSYIYRDITLNEFWSQRLGSEIKRVAALKNVDSEGDFSREFGLLISLGNGKSFVVEYLNEEEWPDMMRVSSRPLDGLSCAVEFL